MKRSYQFRWVALLWPAFVPGCMAPHVNIPARLPNAPTGSAFVQEVRNLSLDDRETRILSEITQGNVPQFLRTCIPVRVTANGHHGRFYCLPDYLSIGTDADFVRMPMTPSTALAIAHRFGCVLPTRKMVNGIYTQATVKLAPSPFSPRDFDITSVEVFWKSQQRIEEQRAGQPLGLLIAGIKKDLVITPQLATKPGKVAIYGWHKLDGQPIQPLYLGHTARWVDYSQCIRLIADTMDVDGTRMRVRDVLNDPELALLLSDEGAFEYPPLQNPTLP